MVTVGTWAAKKMSVDIFCDEIRDFYTAGPVNRGLFEALGRKMVLVRSVSAESRGIKSKWVSSQST